MSPSERLPEFDAPPVVEVAVSIQFKSPSLTVFQSALWWNQIRDHFPKIEQVPPLAPAVETFEPPKSRTAPRISLSWSDVPPTPRILMTGQSDAELIQVQQDRFGFNWRKLRPGHTYPRYASIRKKFVEHLNIFQKFLETEHLDNLVPTQCEVAYVNHIFREGVWQQHGELHKVIPSVTPHLSDDFLPECEEVQFSSRYRIADRENKPLGRLYVSVEPQYRPSDMAPLFQMRLTARGAPQGEGQEGLLDTLDIGHEWIVRGFTTLTSPEMHKAWRRKS